VAKISDAQTANAGRDKIIYLSQTNTATLDGSASSGNSFQWREISTGKKDGIAYWPQVIEEFKKAEIPYQKFNIQDRIKLDVHEGVHEAVVNDGVKFLTKWLHPK
jgi:hypothetical protein